MINGTQKGTEDLYSLEIDYEQQLHLIKLHMIILGFLELTKSLLWVKLG